MLLIRPATAEDFGAITRIYGHHVLHGTGSFELDAPEQTQMLARWQDVTGSGWPWLVAEQSGLPEDLDAAATLAPATGVRTAAASATSADSGPKHTIVGYAYAAMYRPRRAFRFCVEDSIYIDPRVQGRGVGRLLLAELMARCQALGARQMVAVIGDSANAGSVALHARAGFSSSGRIDAAGWKFGRWLDVVLMQRALGQGSATVPDHA